MNHHAETLSERLDILERQNRRWRLAALLAMIGLLAVFAMAQTSTRRVVNAELVTARAFHLIDSAGKVRADLDMKEGNPGLMLCDGAGNGRAHLTLVEGDPHLQFDDAVGHMMVSLSATALGPMIAVHGPSGSVMAALTITYGAPQLQLIGAGGSTSALLTANSTGANLDMHDREGFSTLIGAVDLLTTPAAQPQHRSAASVMLFNKSGKVIWSAP